MIRRPPAWLSVNTTPPRRRWLAWLAFGVAGLWLVASAVAQPAGALIPRNIQFAQLTTTAGLSQQFIQAAVQDASGHVWFGTQEGLNRFDGHDVVVYQHDRGNPESLSDNFIWSLFVDRAGTLWVGTERGLNRYDARTDTFSQPFARFGAGRKFGQPRVRAITQDRNGVYWIGTVDQGLIAIDPQQQQVQRWSPRSAAGGLPAGSVIALLEDSKGQIWLGTNGGGVARFDRLTATFHTYRRVADDPTSLSDDQVRALYEDHSGRIWVGTAAGGLNLFDALTGTFERMQHDPKDNTSISQGQVLALLEDRTGSLWAGTETGLCEWRPDSHGFVCYRHDPLDASSLINDRVNALLEDRSGVLWLGTHGGVSRWNRVSETFNYYRSANGFLAADTVTSVGEARDGSLWVGTYGGGLSHLNLATGKVQHFRHDATNPRSLADDRVMALYVDPDDVVWVGTRGGGLNRLDAAGHFLRYVHADGDLASLSGNAITSIARDAHGALWVGVFDGGLNRMLPGGGFEHFRHDARQPTTLSSDRVLALFKDRGGRLWIGTEQAGLNLFDPRLLQFQHVPLQPRAKTGEHQITAWDITESSDGSLWVATLGDGLFQWRGIDRRAGTQRFLHFQKSDGLASDTVYGLLEGAPGMLWLSSSQGLTLLDTNSGKVRYFDQRNGLRGNEFNLGAHLRSRAGQLYFGSADGLVGFHPADLPSNRFVPPISLSAISRDKPMARAAADGKVPVIELGYLDPFVAFEFVALDFTSPDKNRYRYWMEGLDTDWVDAARFRRAVYSHLPPGDYVFHVQAANNDNVWNTSGAAVAVRVAPPPWNTRAAFVVYAGLVLMLALLLWRAQRLRSIRAAAVREELARQVAERTRDLDASLQDLQRLNAQLAEASITDSLTGLRNRRYLDEVMNAEAALVERRVTERAQAGGSVPDNDSSHLLFFMMIDLDGFKRINDTHGHHAGDEALLQVKDILLECVRQSDSVVRWGGDEFMVFGHVATFNGAKTLAERIRDGIARHRFRVADAHYCSMTASIGVAPFPLCEDRVALCRWEQVAALADQCAYLAKTARRDAWVSLTGAATLTNADLRDISDSLGMLVARGALLLDSSIPVERLLAPGGKPSSTSVAAD